MQPERTPPRWGNAQRNRVVVHSANRRIDRGAIHRNRTTALWPIRIRRGVTVLELLLSIAILTVLAGLLLPAISVARESARRIQCTGHLREVGFALHSHHNAARSLPSGWTFDPLNQSAYGWAVPTLPFLGQLSLAERIDCNKAVNDTLHNQVRQVSLPMLLCPSDIAESKFMLFAEADDDRDDRSFPASVSPPLPPGDSVTIPVALIELPTRWCGWSVRHSRGSTIRWRMNAIFPAAMAAGPTFCGAMVAFVLSVRTSIWNSITN